MPDEGTTGPWVDETDIRPTIMYLTGLKDDYEHDGRVITQVLANPNRRCGAKGVTALGECYKQLNSSVGEFGTATLQVATKGIESNTPGDKTYLATDKELRKLDVARDRLAGVIKGDLENAAFENTTVHHAGRPDRRLRRPDQRCGAPRLRALIRIAPGRARRQPPGTARAFRPETGRGARAAVRAAGQPGRLCTCRCGRRDACDGGSER